MRVSRAVDSTNWYARFCLRQVDLALLEYVDLSGSAAYELACWMPSMRDALVGYFELLVLRKGMSIGSILSLLTTVS